jgi:hypothetical protein
MRSVCQVPIDLFLPAASTHGELTVGVDCSQHILLLATDRDCSQVWDSITCMPRLISAYSYVESLEDRVRTLEALLSESKVPADSDSGPAATAQNGVVEMITRTLRNVNNPFPMPHSDDLIFVDIAENLGAFSLNTPGSHAFHGKSSQAMLLKTAMDLKGSKFTATDTTNNPRLSKPRGLDSVCCGIDSVRLDYYAIPSSEMGYSWTPHTFAQPTNSRTKS